MDIIFMNSKYSKTSDHHILLFDITAKTKLKRIAEKYKNVVQKH